MIHHAVSVLGFVIFTGLAWLLSSNRRRIAWEDHRLGCGTANHHRSDHFPFTWLTQNPCSG